ncbi:type II secretion system minor pseudopilin GspI [Paraburkholderia sp.]|uniref:type II secretion system minor pseudopilin GspI n=1 Tax=Paraburkholderia sp. TaxID=1926495 RepID=UPI003D6DC0A3
MILPAVGSIRSRRLPTVSSRGFTLIEVLIALAIVAIAMGAALRAVGAMATDTETARARSLALWSADNALADVRIARTWPDIGQQTFSCPQGTYRFVCRQTARASRSPLLREVTIRVYGSVGSTNVLAAVTTEVQDERQR